ncbi:MAG: hypothetical protein KDD04_02055, partial [Sinomicrobium sp.]|nr:hypothetical protein [Sinomicrobium sp.]
MVDGVQAARSSGSLLKPFLYPLSIDQGLVLPSTKIRDIPTFYGPFSPANADEQYRGLVTVHDALVHSLNVPAVRLLNLFGYADFYDYLKAMGLQHLFRAADDYGLPLILGGAEVSVWEMATLFRGLALGGKFSSISCFNQREFQKGNSTAKTAKSAKFIKYIQNAQSSGSLFNFALRNSGNSVVKKEIDTSLGNNSIQLISPGAAYQTLQILRELNRPGSEYYWQQYQDQWPLAWKTGTSYGQRDAWAVGVSPQWTIAVWAGNFTGEGNPELAGSKSAGPILFDLFNMLPKDKNNSWFGRPEMDFKTIHLCAWSGYLASENCPETIAVDAPSGMRPLRLCPWHEKLFVDDQEKYQVCSLCWQNGHYHAVSKLVLPPDISQYLRQQGQLIENVPLHNPECPAEQNADVLEIIYPTENARLWIPREYGGAYQKVTCKAAHRHSSV